MPFRPNWLAQTLQQCRRLLACYRHKTRTSGQPVAEPSEQIIKIHQQPSGEELAQYRLSQKATLESVAEWDRGSIEEPTQTAANTIRALQHVLVRENAIQFWQITGS